MSVEDIILEWQLDKFATALEKGDDIEVLDYGDDNYDADKSMQDKLAQYEREMAEEKEAQSKNNSKDDDDEWETVIDDGTPIV